MSRVAIVAAVIVCAAPAAAQTAYFRLIPDLPIAPGLSEVEPSLGPMAYTDGGQMFVVHASGEAAPADARRFYQESLSALGWAFEGVDEQQVTYLRGRERLTLLIATVGDATYLRATLIIEPASMNAD